MRSGAHLREAEARAANAPQAAPRNKASYCWQGPAPSWLAGRTAHETLRWWWCGLDEHERPAPRGVADIDGIGEAA